jgi:hypothetical protein
MRHLTRQTEARYRSRDKAVDSSRPVCADSVEKLGFSSQSQLSRPCSRYEKFLLGTSAYNSGRDPAIFVACARAHSSSKERKREARPFFRERPIQSFSTSGNGRELFHKGR